MAEKSCQNVDKRWIQQPSINGIHTLLAVKINHYQILIAPDTNKRNKIHGLRYCSHVKKNWIGIKKCHLFIEKYRSRCPDI